MTHERPFGGCKLKLKPLAPNDQGPRVLHSCLELRGVSDLGTPAPPELSVVSLREVLPSLEQEAREWREDAYLSRVRIPLREHTSRSIVASAGFQSPTEEHESLLVRLHSDNSVSSETIAHELPVIQVEPIVLDDSVLDSVAALELALGLADPSMPSLVASGCSFLTLERLRGADVRPIIWRLTLTECLSPGAEQIQIDARTGEFVPNP